MKVGILGGGGCFALNFARYLTLHGIEHFGIGRSGPKVAPLWLAPEGYKFAALHLVHQMPQTLKILDDEQPDVIVQFAAQGEGAASFGANAPDYFETNVVALCRLVIELSKRTYLRRFVQIGSSEVYGSTNHPAKETDLLNPTSPYSVSKAAFDLYLESMWRTQKFPMNIIRPSNCYTEGQQLYRVIPKAIIYALTCQKLPLHGGGKAQKSYLHATDLSRAILTVVENAPLGLVYNVGPHEPISISDLIWHVADACGVAMKVLVEEVPDRMGQDSRYYLDTTRIKGLDWEQKIGLKEGLQKMVAWIRAYPETLTMDTVYHHRP